MKKTLFTAILLLATSFTTVSADTSPPIVDAAWLAKNLEREDLVMLDVQDQAVFSRHHLPGAVNIPFAQWRTDASAKMPGVLRSIEDYEQMLGQKGIGTDDHVVILSTGLQPADLSAPARVFWTLRLLGHEKLSVVDGGLVDYVRKRLGPVMRGTPAAREPVSYKARPNMKLLARADDIQTAELLIDARSPEEYLGLRSGGEEERPGTIHGAVNLPYSWLTQQASSGKLLNETDMRALIQKAGVTPTDGAVHFCHTGNRASLTWFIDYAVLGNRKARLYDASMLEWARDPKREIELKWEL